MPTFTSGARIRARVYRASDGFETLAGWYDSQLDYSCTFDGSKFGICPYVLDDSDFPAPSERFTDSACTLPFFATVTSSPSVVQYTTTSTHYYQLTTGSFEVYRLDGASCEDAGPLSGMQVVAEIAPADMSLPTLTEHMTQDDVGYVSAESPDGFSAVVQVAGPVTDVIDQAPTRLRNVYEELGSVRRIVGALDATLDHVCAFGTDSSPLSCIPFGDSASDITSGLTTPDCSLDGDSVRADRRCAKQPRLRAASQRAAVRPQRPVIRQAGQIVGFRCVPLTNLATTTLVTM